MDNIIRWHRRTLPPVLAGMAIIEVVAASISTVSSLLISSSRRWSRTCGCIAEARGRRMGERALSVSSQAVTLGLGAVVFVLAVVPPDVIWKINMFAFGGLETAFLFVLVCGLFWKRANATGALLSLAGGTLAYCAAMAAGFKVADLHQIVIGIVVAGVHGRRLLAGKAPASAGGVLPQLRQRRGGCRLIDSAG
ncbi:MAG: sodium:solute symporter family transporter [Eggerthella lenta]